MCVQGYTQYLWTLTHQHTAGCGEQNTNVPSITAILHAMHTETVHQQTLKLSRAIKATKKVYHTGACIIRREMTERRQMTTTTMHFEVPIKKRACDWWPIYMLSTSFRKSSRESILAVWLKNIQVYTESSPWRVGFYLQASQHSKLFPSTSAL